MGRLDVALSAFILFITNAITIAFAASLVFFSLRFRGQIINQNQRLARNLILSAILTALLLGSLSFFSYQAFQKANINREIETIITDEVRKMDDAELEEWSSITEGDTIHLYIVLRAMKMLRYEDSVSLQKAIADRLQKPVAVVVNQVFAARLDPLIPPTPTMTSTSTLPNTPIFSSTPALAHSVGAQIPSLLLRQVPCGPEIGTIRYNQPLTILYGEEVLDGLVWIEVQDSEGRIGWIPEIYLKFITLTPTITSTPTNTIIPTETGIITPTVMESSTFTTSISVTGTGDEFSEPSPLTPQNPTQAATKSVIVPTSTP